MTSLRILLAFCAAAALWSSVAEEVDWGLRALPAPMARDHLIGLVSTGALDDRREALRLVAAAQRAAARPVVLAAAVASEAPIATDALAYLATLGPGSLAEDPVLRQGLGRSEEQVRRAAVHCLAVWGERRFVPDLAAMLGPADAAMRTTLAEALTRVTGERLGAEEQPWKEWAASESAEAIARLEAIRDRFNDPGQAVDEPTIASLAAFRGRTSEAMDLLQPLLRHPDAKVVAAVVRTMRVIRPLTVRELDPETQALTAGPSASSGAVAPPPAPVPVASDGGLVGGLVAMLVVGVLLVALWLWLGCTRSGRRVINRTTRLVRRQGSRTAAIARHLTGAIVVRLKGRRPPSDGNPFT